MEKRIAFVISGAAAFIGQELALCKALIEGLYPDGEKIIPVALAGASSGSLSSVMVDGILRNKADSTKGVSWDKLENQMLFPMKNKKVFKTGILASANDLFAVVAKGFLLNTKPLKKTLTRFISSPEFMNYQTLGDAQTNLHISSVNRETAKVRRFASENPEDAKLNIVDVLMASAAIPGIFPHRKIKGVDGFWTDGGFGTDSIPVEALEHELHTSGKKFDAIYVITYDHKTKNVNQKENSFIGNLSFALKNMLGAAFPLQLFGALGLVEDENNAFIYTPELTGKYSILNFGQMKEQFTETAAWAAQNKPMLIKDYLKLNHSNLKNPQVS